jgi:hypothetical protein
MKKTIRKLVLHSEAIRTLRALDSRDLTRAVGGLIQSTDVCTSRFVESGKVDCPALVLTAACG